MNYRMLLVLVVGCSDRHVAGGGVDAEVPGPAVTDGGALSTDLGAPDAEADAPVPAFEAEYISWNMWPGEHVLVDETRVVLTRDLYTSDFCSGILSEGEQRVIWNALVEADFFSQPESYDDGTKCPIQEAGVTLAVRVGEMRHVIYNFDACPAVPQAVLDLLEALEAAAEQATNCRASPCMATGCYGEICASSSQESPCEWLDEYACYGDAFCRRQDGGDCGFTSGPFVDECLADR